MSAVQTTVADKAVAFAGMRASAEDKTVVRSYVSEESTAEIPFGFCLAQGTADNGAKIPVGSTTVRNIVGVVTQRHEYARTVTLADGTVVGELGSTGLRPGVDLALMTSGEVWVTVEDNVTPNTKPYLRIAGTGTPGLFRGTSDTTNTLDCSAFARFTSSASGGGLAKLAFDLSGRNATPQ